MGHGDAARGVNRALAEAAWAEVREPLDRQLSPLGAIGTLFPEPGEDVLDVGCGTGQTLLQLAAMVGPSGSVVGLDIAPRLLAIARERAAAHPNISFIEADAQTVRLPAAGFDAIYSRFGVMAFADPVAAFSNLRNALRFGGRLVFVCWRALAHNELDHAPLRAAGLEHLADMTPFSFSDHNYVVRVLRNAGFSDIAADVRNSWVSCGGVDETLAVALAVGPQGRILRENPDLRPEAEPRVRRMLESRASGGYVEFRAATWVVTAWADGSQLQSLLKRRRYMLSRVSRQTNAAETGSGDATTEPS